MPFYLLVWGAIAAVACALLLAVYLDLRDGRR